MKWTHTRIFLQFQASSLKLQTHSVKMETEVHEGGGGGTCVTLLAMQKTSLSMCFPTSTTKMKRCLFSKYAQSLLSYFKENKSQNTLLSFFYITVIITNFL